jgi:hypothetical protein
MNREEVALVPYKTTQWLKLIHGPYGLRINLYTKLQVYMEGDQLDQYNYGNKLFYVTLL